MRRFLLASTAVAIITGCAGGIATSATTPGGDPCIIAPTGTSPLDTIRIALPSTFDPARVFRPANPTEATLVAALYETLVTTDCRDQPVPSLTASWVADATGTRWTFELRSDATFRDGMPVTAQDVAAAWSDRSRPRDMTRTGLTTGNVRELIRTVVVTGQHSLTVQLDGPADATLFADPALSVHRATASSPWPVGTGPYEVVEEGPPARTGYSAVELRRSLHGQPIARAQAPLVLDFAMPPSGDLRNALDLGADVVITRDDAVLDYARALADYTSTALPWDRTYLLLSPSALIATPLPEGVREGLARDAVRGEARAATPMPAPTTAPGDTSAPRSVAARTTTPPGASARIVYTRGDDAARGLAERLVALASALDEHPWLASRLPATHDFTAHGLDPAAFNTALQRGTDAAYVIAMPTRDLNASAGFAQDLTWLPASPVALAAAITPLVETRARAIHRMNLGPARVDATGAVHFAIPANTTRR